MDDNRDIDARDAVTVDLEGFDGMKVEPSENPNCLYYLNRMNDWKLVPTPIAVPSSIQDKNLVIDKHISNLKILDGKGFFASKAFTADTVTMVLNIDKAQKYRTLYLPFKPQKMIINGVETTGEEAIAATLGLGKFYYANQDRAVFQHVSAVKETTPYLIDLSKVGDADSILLIANDVKIDNAKRMDEEEHMQGAYTVYPMKDVMLLDGEHFVHADSVSSTPFTGYLLHVGTSPLKVVFDDKNVIGDFNRDGVLDYNDLWGFAQSLPYTIEDDGIPKQYANYKKMGYYYPASGYLCQKICEADLTGDGLFDLDDIVILINAIEGQHEPAPHSIDVTEMGSDGISLTVSEEGIQMNLDKMNEYIAFMFDIHIPMQAIETFGELNTYWYTFVNVNTVSTDFGSQTLNYRPSSPYGEEDGLSLRMRFLCQNVFSISGINIALPAELESTSVRIDNIKFFTLSERCDHYPDQEITWPSTGIRETRAERSDFNVYTLTGTKARSKATSLEGLPKGVYIVNGKKVVRQ